MLKELKELIMVVDQNRSGVSALLGMNSKTNVSKLRKLYDGIAQGHYLSDDDAAAKLYPNESGKSAYRKLKSTLRDKLINSLFDLDLKSSEYNEYQKAYYECHKQWAAAKILLGKNANHAALDVCTKLLKQAERFEFTALSMDIALTLRVHYSIREGNREKYLFFGDYVDQYSELYLKENKAERLYLDLIINQVTSKAAKENTLTQGELAYRTIESILEQSNSYRLSMYASLIYLSYFSMKQDFRQALQVCKRFIDYFQSKNYEAHVPLQILHYQELVCSFHLRLFSERESLAQNCRKYLQEGTYNWFKYQELLLQMAMYDGDYEQAWKIFHQTTSHSRFGFLPENVSEVWAITRAYLYFLVKTNCLDLNLKKLPIQSFRVRKFDNETTLYAKDKKGLNIPILIAQFLILLTEKKLNQAIDQVAAIEQYSYRHLRGKETERSRLFIKMLVQIPQSSFIKSEFVTRANPLLQELQSIPPQLNMNLTEIEILPYEAIWTILCQFF